MVELLTAERAALGRQPVPLDFAAAWTRSWMVMVLERAWPHGTRSRRAWRAAMDETAEACGEAFRAGTLTGWVPTCRERRAEIQGLAASDKG